MNMHKTHIASRFGAAADSYDAASPIQLHSARQLAERVSALSLPDVPRVLEIGCGTGHLTRELLPRVGGNWIITDIAAEMVYACRTKHGATAKYVVMDGERPSFGRDSFDLIVTSLAAQWFNDLPATLVALAPLLKPGGQIALATLGVGTFSEWRAAHRVAGLTAATPDYPDAVQLAGMFPAMMSATVTEELVADPNVKPIEFVRGLRAIGATATRADRTPLTAGQLRKVLSALPTMARHGVSYHLLYAVANRIS